MNNKRILVVGLGVSGRAAAEFLLGKGAVVHGTDSNQKVLAGPEVARLQKNGLVVCSEEQISSVDEFELVVVSPGVPPTQKQYAAALAAGIEVIGEVELACRFMHNAKVLGITGTNGKTTVTLLVTHVLKENGYPARALGNMGVPITSQCESAQNEIIVAELSSYQLDTMRTKILDAAVLLNVTPDHLDRYHTMEAYAKSKWHIHDCLKSGGKLYVEEKCAEEYGNLAPGKYLTYGYGKGCHLSTDLKQLFAEKNTLGVLPEPMQGKKSHDLENVMAAFALCSHVGVSWEQFVSALSTFKKPSHRIEFVTTINGVSYYDDSKGTNIDAVIRAVDSLEGNIILIAGGVDKGAAYTPWIEAFADKVKCICAIGQAAPKLEKDLSHAFKIERCESLEAAVAKASRLAKSKEIVLLSPGCSSFDMFKDYAHRGEVFQEAVKKLKTTLER